MHILPRSFPQGQKSFRGGQISIFTIEYSLIMSSSDIEPTPPPQDSSESAERINQIKIDLYPIGVKGLPRKAASVTEPFFDRKIGYFIGLLLAAPTSGRVLLSVLGQKKEDKEAYLQEESPKMPEESQNARQNVTRRKFLGMLTATLGTLMLFRPRLPAQTLSRIHLSLYRVYTNPFVVNLRSRVANSLEAYKKRIEVQDELRLSEIQNIEKLANGKGELYHLNLE